MLFLEIADTDYFFSAVDVETADYGVCVRARGDVDLDLGVGGCEAGEDGGAEECAVDVSIIRSNVDCFNSVECSNGKKCFESQ